MFCKLSKLENEEKVIGYIYKKYDGEEVLNVYLKVIVSQTENTYMHLISIYTKKRYKKYPSAKNILVKFIKSHLVSFIVLCGTIIEIPDKIYKIEINKQDLFTILNSINSKWNIEDTYNYNYSETYTTIRYLLSNEDRIEFLELEKL